MARIISFVFLCCMFLAKAQAQDQPTKSPGRVIFGRENRASDTIKTTDASGTTIFIPNVKPDIDSTFEANGKKYRYTLSKSEKIKNGYSLTIQELLREGDTDNWKNIYNAKVSTEDLSATKQFKVTIGYSANEGYSWRPYQGSYLETTFDLNRKKMRYVAVGRMKKYMRFQNQNREILSFQESSLPMEKALDYSVKYFVAKTYN